MFLNFDKKLTIFIAKSFNLNYKQAETFKFAFYILILFFLLSLLLILGFNAFNNNQATKNSNSNVKNNDLQENIISATPTKFIIPTPTATKEEVTTRNLLNEIILNDTNLFHSITIKKNTILKFINLTQRSVILKTNNDIFIKIDVGSSEALSFPDIGEFIIKDAEYIDNGYFIKVNVIE